MEQHDVANRFAKEHVHIEIANTDKALYIELEMQGVIAKETRDSCRCCSTVKLIVADGHTNVNSIEVDGKKVFEFSVNETTSKIIT